MLVLTQFVIPGERNDSVVSGIGVSGFGVGFILADRFVATLSLFLFFFFFSLVFTGVIIGWASTSRCKQKLDILVNVRTMKNVNLAKCV